jgi:hypothetical protein
MCRVNMPIAPMTSYLDSFIICFICLKIVQELWCLSQMRSHPAPEHTGELSLSHRGALARPRPLLPAPVVDALANPLGLGTPLPVPPPPLPATPLPVARGTPRPAVVNLERGAGMEIFDVDLDDVGGFSTNDVSVVLEGRE